MGSILNSGDNAQLWSCNHTGGQQFLYDVNEGTFQLSADPQYCLDLAGGNASNGSNIELQLCDNSGSQQFDHDHDQHMVRSRLDSTKCWDVAYGSNFLLWDCHGGTNQRFDILYQHAPQEQPTAPAFYWKTIYEGDWGVWKGSVERNHEYVCGAQVQFEDDQGGGDDTAMNGLKFRFCDLNGNTTATETIYEGDWGDWKPLVEDSNFKACGARVRYEDAQGQGSGDDTAMNGLKLSFCDDYAFQTEKTVYEGLWGNWKSNYVDSNYHVCGAQVKYEDDVVAGDDTAMNGLKLKFCKNHAPESYWQTIYEGNWGVWKDAVERNNDYVCGAQVQFEDNQGGGDDTAMNGLKLRFCGFNGHTTVTETIYEGDWGDWKTMVDHSNFKACGAQVRYEDSQGDGDDTAMNGLKLSFCDNNSFHSQKTIYEGLWGNWKSNYVDSSYHVCGAQVKYEDSAGDDTAMNGLKLKFCPN